MPSLLRRATCGWRRKVFHCPQLTPIFRNSRSLCIIHSQDSSLMPPKMRKVQLRWTFILNYDSRNPTIEPPMWSTLPPPFTAPHTARRVGQPWLCPIITGRQFRWRSPLKNSGRSHAVQ